jgi:hypothetical protein
MGTRMGLSSMDGRLKGPLEGDTLVVDTVNFNGRRVGLNRQ